MDVDLEELAAIIEQLDKADFSEFRYEKGDLRLVVRRQSSADPDDLAGAPLATAVRPEQAGVAAVPTVPTVPTVPAPGGTAPADRVAARPSTSGGSAVTPDTLPADHVLVRAPMLGTFYRSPKPGEPPLAEVGDKVAGDSSLCIIEVMKLMNSVPAGVEGELAAVFVQDGDLVEFDQPLFAIRTTA